MRWNSRVARAFCAWLNLPTSVQTHCSSETDENKMRHARSIAERVVWGGKNKHDRNQLRTSNYNILYLDNEYRKPQLFNFRVRLSNPFIIIIYLSIHNFINLTSIYNNNNNSVSVNAVFLKRIWVGSFHWKPYRVTQSSEKYFFLWYSHFFFCKRMPIDLKKNYIKRNRINLANHNKTDFFFRDIIITN